MKFVCYELKKYLHSAFMAALFAVIIACSVAVSFPSERTRQFNLATASAYSDYLNNTDNTEEYYNNLSKVLRENITIDELVLPRTYSNSADDYIILNEAINRANWLQEHKDKCLALATTARSRADDLILVLGTDSNPAVQGQIKLSAVMNNISETVYISSGYAYGYDSFLNNKLLMIPIGLFSIVSSLFVFLYDKDIGSVFYTSITRNGRKTTRFAKIVAIVIVVFVGCFIILGSSLSVYAFRTGLSDFSTPVQALPGFEFVPFVCSIGEFTVIHSLLRIAAAELLALFVAFIAILSGSHLIAISGGVAVSAACALIFYRSHIGTTSVIRYFNPAAFADASGILSFYRSSAALGFAIDAITKASVLYFLEILVSLFLVLYIKQNRTNSCMPLCFALQKRRKSKRKPGCSIHIIGLVPYESIKVRFFISSIIIIICLTTSFTFQLNKLNQDNGYGEALYYSYIDRISSIPAKERPTFIEEERARIDSIINDYSYQTASFESGQTDRKTYNYYLKQYYTACSESVAFRRVETNSNYVFHQNQRTGLSLCPVYDTGIIKLNESQCDWFLIFVLLVSLFDTYVIEHRTGMMQILKTTKKGRKKTFFSKVLYCCSVGAMCSFSFYLVRLIATIHTYPLPKINSPICSIIGFSAFSSIITIEGWIVLSAFFAAVFGALSGALICLISMITKVTWLSIISSTALITVPELLSTNRIINPGLSIASLFHPAILFENNNNYSFSPAIISLLLIVSLLLTVNLLENNTE